MIRATAIAVMLVAGCSFPLLRHALNSPRFLKENFQDKMIPSVLGGYIAVYSLVGCFLTIAYRLCDTTVGILYIASIGGMAALGLLDDAFGTREAGGFAGHFKKLLLERKLTTGMVKAIGGGILALAVGYTISREPVVRLLNALLIALCANALNLVDLRPGRALGVFAFGLLVILAVCGLRISGAWPLAALLVPTVAIARAEVTGRGMMGDTGSNALGAALGLTLALDAPLWAKIAAVVVLVCLHVFCERYSLTRTIERNSTFKKIDSLLGVR